jgi:hypothetical protein
LLDEGLLEKVRENRIREIDGMLKEVLGEGYTFEELTST